MLVVYQLDLLADLERQLRAVQHTMRHIEKLRAVRMRVGPALSNGQRESTLKSLADEIHTLESHLTIEQSCCADMHMTIAHMRERVIRLRERTAADTSQKPDSSPDSGAQS